ncbi:MAG: hypothetical protein ACI3XA_04635 [Clostridia bacterium]
MENKNPFLRNVPKGNSQSPGIKQIAVRGGLPEVSTNSPEARQIAVKGSVPEGSSNNPVRQSPVKAAVPEGKSNNPVRQSPVKAAVPKGNSNNPENSQIAIKGGVPKVNTDNPKADIVIPVASRPEAVQTSIQHIGGWKGLNKRCTVDSGALSEAVNVSFKNFPFVESGKVAEEILRITFTLGGEEKSISEIYDVVTRGKKIFIACDLGYVYGEVTDKGFCYIPIGNSANTNNPTEKTRVTFAETYDTKNSVITVNENICAFTTYVQVGSSEREYLPVLPSGSIQFVDEVVESTFYKKADGALDTSLIYVVCKDGKADEVWRYFSYVPRYCDSNYKYSAWVELRRNIYVVAGDGEAYVSYMDKNGVCIGELPETHYIGNKLYYAGSKSELNIKTIDEKLSAKGIYADDVIDGKKVHYKNNTDYHYGPGILNYEAATPPKFDSVTFYKGRVFGSSGSFIICSEYNNYKGWTLDNTDTINSANAWMSTTTANSSADGNIVAMHEYLGRISVLKSGFMQEVYGGSNPFSVQDVYAVGTPFPYGVCEAYGRLCFAGKTALRTYGGSFPKVIGDEIGVDVYDDVIMLGNDRSLLVKTGDEVFLYDFILGMWVQMQSEHFEGVKRFFMLGGDMYAVTNGGSIIKLDGSDYGEWSFATCAMTESTLSLKRLQKIRLTYSLEPGASFDMSVVKSDDSEMKALSRENSTGKTVVKRAEASFTNAVDWFLKLKFKGKGYFRLISLDIEIKNGGSAAYE